jgi:hypothetical protein
MRIQKPEKLTGYILLTVGFILILVPIVLSILIVLGSMPIPMYVQKPTVSGTDPSAELARVMADAFPLLNVIPTFLLFVVIVYAGSVLMGKGVGLIKEINWKVVRTPRAGTEETEPEDAVSVQPAKKARTQKDNE